MTDWTVGERNDDIVVTSKREQLPHWGAFEVTKDTTKEMKVTIDRWNLMRQRLLDTNEMEAQ